MCLLDVEQAEELLLIFEARAGRVAEGHAHAAVLGLEEIHASSCPADRRSPTSRGSSGAAARRTPRRLRAPAPAGCASLRYSPCVLPLLGERADARTDGGGEQADVVRAAGVDAAARSRRGRGPASAAWRPKWKRSSTVRPSPRVDEQACRRRCAPGRIGTPPCAVMSVARQHHRLDRRDLLAQLRRLGVARGQRLVELALEAEVARVEHHRVDVAEDRVEVVVAEDVQLADPAASAPRRPAARATGVRRPARLRRRRYCFGPAACSCSRLVRQLHAPSACRFVASMSWLARSRPVIASFA